MAESLQSFPTLCDPRDGSPLGSPIPGILQARTLEWVAISFSSAWKWKVKVKSLSHVRLLATPLTVAYQAPPPMGFSRQEYWSGLPLPSPRCRWHHPYDRKWRGTKKPLDESERGEWKIWLKAQHSGNEDHVLGSCPGGSRVIWQGDGVGEEKTYLLRNIKEIKK